MKYIVSSRQTGQTQFKCRTHTHKHARMHERRHAGTHTHTHTHTHHSSCIYAHTCTHIHTHIRIAIIIPVCKLAKKKVANSIKIITKVIKDFAEAFQASI